MYKWVLNTPQYSKIFLIWNQFETVIDLESEEEFRQ